MSKQLSTILVKLHDDKILYEDAEQQIKDLLLELIGEAPAYSQPGMYEINVENKLRAKLRQKVEQL